MSKINLYEIQLKWVDFFVFISYLTYAIIIFGISATAPKYIEYIQDFFTIYTGLFLVWRFNKFNKLRFSELDRRIALSAGIFILSTTIINRIILAYAESTRSFILSTFDSIIKTNN